MTTPDLGTYVQRTTVLPWRWGDQDCTMWVSDWCLIRWGIDPAEKYRGTYTTEAEMLAIIEPGLLAVVEPEISLPRKSAPVEGDIGIIEVAGRQIAAIWSGQHWLFRTPRGVGMTRRAAIAIWGD